MQIVYLSAKVKYLGHVLNMCLYGGERPLQMPVNPLAERHLLPAVEQPHRLLDALMKLLVTAAAVRLLLRFVH